MRIICNRTNPAMNITEDLLQVAGLCIDVSCIHYQRIGGGELAVLKIVYKTTNGVVGSFSIISVWKICKMSSKLRGMSGIEDDAF